MSSRPSPSGCQASPSSAHRRTAGPETAPGAPPTQIGGCGTCSAGARRWRPLKLTYSPLYSGTSAGPGRLDRADVVVAQPAALPERQAQVHELGLVPAHADAEDEPPARRLVDGGRRLGRHQRVAVGQYDDAGAELDAPRPPGEKGQERERIRPVRRRSAGWWRAWPGCGRGRRRHRGPAPRRASASDSASATVSCQIGSTTPSSCEVPIARRARAGAGPRPMAPGTDPSLRPWRP